LTFTHDGERRPGWYVDVDLLATTPSNDWARVTSTIASASSLTGVIDSCGPLRTVASNSARRSCHGRLMHSVPPTDNRSNTTNAWGR